MFGGSGSVFLSEVVCCSLQSEPVGLGTCCNLCRSNEPLPNY